MEALRIKKFRQKLKNRLSTQTKHITKEELARQKAEEKRKLYEKRVEGYKRDWSKAAKEPAPRLRSRRESTKAMVDFGSLKKGGGGGVKKTPRRKQGKEGIGEGVIGVGMGGMDESNVIPSIQDVSPMVGNKSVVNIEVPAVDWGSSDASAARGRLLKFKKK
jgi:hypothetical protein